MSIATMHPPSRGKWMALIAAMLGWLFDGFEMGLFPLIGKKALEDLLQLPSGNVVIDQWFGVILAVFLIGAATGTRLTVAAEPLRGVTVYRSPT